MDENQEGIYLSDLEAVLHGDCEKTEIARTSKVKRMLQPEMLPPGKFISKMNNGLLLMEYLALSLQVEGFGNLKESLGHYFTNSREAQDDTWDIITKLTKLPQVLYLGLGRVKNMGQKLVKVIYKNTFGVAKSIDVLTFTLRSMTDLLSRRRWTCRNIPKQGIWEMPLTLCTGN